MKITGASFAATSASAGILTQGDVKIAVNNGSTSSIDALYKIEDAWVKDETKMDDVTILAILSAKNTTTNQLLPLSMTSGSATGITSVKTSTPMESIYNLMGVRISQLKRGINIVNGQKVMVK